MSAEMNNVPTQEADAVPLPVSPAVEESDTMVILHDAADLTIVIKSAKGTHLYKVSSMNLATASDVLRAVIFGKDGQKKSVGDADVTMDIGDVDPKAMGTLLRISHFDFAKVPRELDLDDLCAVTALTAKYNCTSLIMPWASNWIQPLAHLYKDESAHAVNFKAANIAWELGDAKLLRQMVKDIIMTAKVDADGDLEHVTGAKLKDLVLPAGILDEIVAIRTQTIEKILAAIQSAFDNAGQTGGVKYCKTGNDAEKCQTMMIGSAVSSLMPIGLFPVPKAETYKENITTLVAKLEGCTMQHWEGRNYAPHASHSGCNLRFTENAQIAVKGMADPLKEEQIEHLVKQAASSGVHFQQSDDEEEAPARRTRFTDTISGTGELLASSRSASPKSTVSN
ncbi:hypothetical protein PG985_000032 [Apiospora marii]|uniref:BTB domain-containing protein n=1 Tax=Apiospora marii TaxID=335849 RepID=A0ABR1R0J9_9PEZI